MNSDPMAAFVYADVRRPTAMKLSFFRSFFKNAPWLRRCALSVGCLVLLWILAWLALPPILRSQGEALASKALGRQVTIGRVQFLPWSLEVSLHDVAIADAQGQGFLLQVQRIYIDMELQSLLRLAPVADAVEVDAPVVHVMQLEPGRTDIDDIIEKLSQPGDGKAAPTGFALYNIAVHGGSLDFVDRTVNRTHEVRDLEFSLPFVSNLKAQRQVKVAPRLAFRLNGSAFDTLAEAAPFTDSLRTDATIHLANFDLAPYRDYLPAAFPVRLNSAVVDADVRLSFEQTPATVVQLSGVVRARDVAFVDKERRELFSFDAMKVQLAELQPFARKLRIDAIELDAPSVAVRRDGAGHFNLEWSGQPTQQARVAPAKGPVPTAQAKDLDWSVYVGRVSVRHGQASWQDDGVPAGAKLNLRDLVLQASDLTVPMTKTMHFAGSFEVQGEGSAKTPAGLAFSGKGHPLLGQVAFSVQALPLELAAPYLAQWVSPSLGGVLQADVGLAWNGAALVAQVARLGLDDLRLSCTEALVANCTDVPPASVAMRGSKSLGEIKRLQVENTRINLSRRSVDVGRVVVTQPRALVDRNAEGRWMFERWQVAQPARPLPAAAEKPAPQAPWSVKLSQLEVDGGGIAFRDSMSAEPAAFTVSSLHLRLQDFDPTAESAKPSVVALSARLGAGRADPGRLEYEGTAALAPLRLQGRVLAMQLPLHAFKSYVADALNVDLRRIDGSFKGQVRYAETPAGTALSVQGDAALDDVRVRMAVPAQTDGAKEELSGLRSGEDLLNWKSLGLRGLAVELAPGKPLAVDVQETALSDFFARVIVQANGRLNLQELVKAKSPATTTAVEPAATPASVVSVNTGGLEAASAPVIRFGPISLAGGRVDFTDHFIKPNYSAQLTELNGHLDAFSSVAPAGSDVPEMAGLELRGKAEGTASLDISGKLNPLTRPLALDIRGRMRDLELPPLSPYTIKYAGHGIERGKLSMDVTYQVQPDGRLLASNKLVLQQLTFGDPVEGAPASLPVRLAVALLADRNGVIDVELPISGSLNDPEFRLGPVIFKIIGNLILKAVSAPFSLLTSALGGGAEQGVVAFVPGSSVLDASARTQLDKVVKALIDRPALKMTVAGMASLDADHEGWKREQLQQSLLAQKRRAAVRAGQAAEAVQAVSAEEYPALLKEVYRRSDMTKPRNLVGMAKELPPSEMEALLLASIPVPEESIRALALARGVAVRDYLASRQLPQDRLFLGAAHVVSSQTSWQPRAELTLAVR